jgi:hypothetical protein
MAAVKAKAQRPESDFNLIYVTAFAVFFFAVAVGRLIPRRWRWNVSGHDHERSVVAAAKAAACTTIPFAFM